MTAQRQPTRRAVLVAGLLLPLAGCSGSARARGGASIGAASGSPGAASRAPALDATLRGAAADRERALIARYDQALAADPDDLAVADRLAALRAEHVDHLSALGAQPDPAGSGPPPTAPPTAPPAGTTATPAARAGPALRAALAQAERETGAAHARDVPAASRRLAAVLASLAASEASHPVALA